jgi:hypothetical protein
MELNDEMLEILFRAKALYHQNKGQVLEDEAIPAAHHLAEAGWLARRVEKGGDISWWWTQQAEIALNLGAIVNEQDPN